MEGRALWHPLAVGARARWSVPSQIDLKNARHNAPTIGHENLLLPRLLSLRLLLVGSQRLHEPTQFPL